MWKRLATLAIAGAFTGLAFATPASANPGPNVTFTGGGLGLLLCGSQPDTSRISVSAESRVRLTNSLGMGAQLQIDGAPSAAVANGETVEVQFHRGPVAITMVPECSLNLNRSFPSLTVDVTAAPPVSQPTTPGPRPSTKPPTSPASPPQNPANPQNPTNPQPPLDALPALPPTPLFEEEPSPGPGDAAFPSAATVLDADGNPARKLANNIGPVDSGPIGLLAIIATVCVVGVSAGAIRAIITQRATRAGFA